MPVLVDGNNLLYAALEADPERPPSRTTMCLRLGQWSRRTGESVAVVFDGRAPAGGLARQISASDVEVQFSGSGTSADDVLRELIEAHSAARLLLVVSSDREVVRAAKRRRAKTIGSKDFWSALQRQLARETPRPREPMAKRRGLKKSDTDRWIRKLGLDRE